MAELVEDICTALGLKIANDGWHTRDENQIQHSPDLKLFRNIPNLQWNVDHIIRLNSHHLPIVITLPERDANKVHTMWDIKKRGLELIQNMLQYKF